MSKRSVLSLSAGIMVLSGVLAGCGTSASLSVGSNTTNKSNGVHSNTSVSSNTSVTSKVQNTKSNVSSSNSGSGSTSSNSSGKSSTSSTTSASSSGSVSSSDKAFILKLQQDLKTYVSLEGQYNTDRKQSASGKITNAQFFNQVGALVPKTESLANAIQTLQVPTDVSSSRQLKITTAVQTLSNSVQDMENGLLDIASIETSGDISKMSSANVQIQNSNNLFLKFDTQLTKLNGSNSN